MNDEIRYDLIVQEALRGVVRKVLVDAAREGLPGDHHFFITFKTHAPGVQLSARMRKQYPDEITIVLQHQFWDMSVDDTHFEVGLSFKNVPEKLSVPFDAITGFADPSVQFALRFDTGTADDTQAGSPGDAIQPDIPPDMPDIRPAVPATAPPLAASDDTGPSSPAGQSARPEKTARKGREKAAPKREAAGDDATQEDAPAAGSDNVVSIDAFRKKT